MSVIGNGIKREMVNEENQSFLTMVKKDKLFFLKKGLEKMVPGFAQNHSLRQHSLFKQGHKTLLKSIEKLDI